MEETWKNMHNTRARRVALRFISLRGRRLPMMAIGGLPTALFTALFFFPPVPRESVWNVAWLAVPDFAAVVAVLGHARRTLAEILSAVEFVDATALDCVLGAGVAGDPLDAPGAPFPVSKKPRGFPVFFDFGGPYLGQFGSDSAPSWTVDHLCTSSRDLDTKIARIDSYKVMLKRS